MKKVISLLLVIMLCLSLCACEGETSGTQSEPTIIANEEIIFESTQSGETTISENNDMCIADVLLEVSRTTKDNLGNEDTEALYQYYYGEKGEISAVRISWQITANEWDASYDVDGMWGYFENEYDESGRVSSISVYPSSEKERMEATITISYDGNGNIISEHVLTNDGEYTNLYSYDEMNRVIQKTYTKSSSQYYITDYEYDEMGNLIQKTSTGYSNKDSIGHPNEDKTTVYTLDDVGLVVSSTTVQKYYVFDWEKTTNTTYVYDENGRLIQEHTTCGDFIDSNGEIAEKSKYASYIVDYSYGDYIIGSES